MRRLAFLSHRRAHAFAEAEGASAAVEFALILPFLMLLLFGSIDLTDGVAARRKLALASSTVADLVSQQQTLDGAHADSMFLVSQAIMAPYDASQLKAVVSSVVVDNNGQATVAWSLAKNTTARSKGSSYPLTNGLKVPNSTVIVSELSYTYKAVVGYRFAEVAMADTSAVPPRATGSSTGVACTAPGC